MIKDLSEKELCYTLYGLLLGDGSLRRNKIEKYRLIIKHTNKQKFYCQWLSKMFLGYGLDTINRFDFIQKTNLGEYLYSEVNIRVPKNFYFDKMYNENKKIISKYVMDNITPQGLLLWWLDDGQWHVSIDNSKGKRFGYLNTQSFTYDENVMILNMFKNRFDIDLKIHTDNSGFKHLKHKKYYRLYFNATAFRKFYDVVRNYLKFIPKEFYYKFNMQYTPNRIKRNQEFSDRYNLV